MSEQITPEEIARLKELCEKATAGPWTIESTKSPIGDTGDFEDQCTVAGEDEDIVEIWNPEDHQIENLNFIALCRSLVPRLIEKVEGLERDKERHHCCCCPVEVRNLSATAYNLLANMDSAEVHHRIPEKKERLRDALKLMEPLMARHYAAIARKLSASRRAQTSTKEGFFKP